MLELWTMSLEEILQQDKEEMLERCLPYRKEKYISIKHEKTALLCLGAGLLEARVLDMAPPGTEVILSEYGKPSLSVPGLYYNISHSGDYVILAVADAEVGIDLQEPRALTDSLQNRILTEKEKLTGLYRTPSSWFKLWCIKESYVKLTGMGLQMEFSKLETDWDEDRKGGVITDTTGLFNPAGFRAEKFANDYCLAVSIYKP